MGQDDKNGYDLGSRTLHAEETGSGSTSKLYTLEVGDLTLQECMILYRRRLEISQSQMACLFGVHREKYGMFERGQISHLKADRPALGSLFDHEKCFIFRRRSCWTQEQCAEMMGITRYWFNLMELGKAPCEPLTKFWSENAG
jgi:DNA-binding XRE family transcriptional regulator